MNLFQPMQIYWKIKDDSNIENKIEIMDETTVVVIGGKKKLTLKQKGS